MPTDPVYNPSLPYAGSSSLSDPSTLGMSATRRSISSSEPASASWGLVAGLCAGAAVGAAFALLYTPKRGSEVRSSLRSYASQGGEKLQEIVASGRCLAEDALHRASSLIEEGRRALGTGEANAWGTNQSNASSNLRSVSRSEPLTASVAELSGIDRRFEEPLGG